MKRKCAKKALEMIKDDMVVGLGGGSTVSMLIEEIQEAKLNIQVVTPSSDTMKCCMEHGLQVLPIEYVSHIDVAFDGCDELDVHLNALKSCGGIHTREHIVAVLADNYVLLGDEEKYKLELTTKFPVVLEVLPEAKSYVEHELMKMECATISWRTAVGKAGYQITDDGNYLVDVTFDEMPEAGQLQHNLKMLTGVVETSLFYQVATKAIIAGKEDVRIVTREQYCITE